MTFCIVSIPVLIGSLQGKPPRHPVALALFEASQQGNIPAYHLKRIIDARVRASVLPACKY